MINDTVGALMSCALDDRECAIGLILGKLPIDTVEALMSCALQDSNVSGYRYVSDCRSRGREFDPGPVPYFRGD